MISMNVESRAPQDPNAPDALIEEIQRNARGTNRIVMDLTTAAAPLARRIMKMSPTILIPVAPDMNSVISLNAVEQFFKNQTDAAGRPVKVYYLLNQFDPAQPLHLDVREVLRQQLGDRLLPFVIRRSPAVSEALAEGMTVMDYAPNSPAAEDYLNLANWLRNISAPVSAGFRGVRWSEQP
jgi:cellulose synthase operon protein YhjQ